MPNIRKPVVAGQFYSDTPEALKKQIGSFIKGQEHKKDVIGCILPHAGYVYSGKVASLTVSGIDLKENIILFGPNHTGNGVAFSVMSQGAWLTPLGKVDINENLAGKIINTSRYLKDDILAHLYEHSLEVELPILQFFKKDFKIVPIAFSSDNVEILEKTGLEIADAIKGMAIENSVLLVASSDMTHYEPADTAKKKDYQAIEAVLELDGKKLFQRIHKFDISMCGYAPVIAMMSAAKSLGAKKAELVNYANSGDITGDYSSVVGYAGMVIV